MDMTEVIRKRRNVLYEKTSMVEKLGRQNSYDILEGKIKLYKTYAKYLDDCIEVKQGYLTSKEMEVMQWQNVIEWCRENPLGVTVDPVKQIHRNIYSINQEIRKLRNKLHDLRQSKANNEAAIKEVQLRKISVLEKRNTSCSNFLAAAILSDRNAQLVTKKGHEAQHGPRKTGHAQHAPAKEGNHALYSTGKEPVQGLQHSTGNEAVQDAQHSAGEEPNHKARQAMLLLEQGAPSTSLSTKCVQDPRLKLQHSIESPVLKRARLEANIPQAMEKSEDPGSHLPLKESLPLLKVRPLQEMKLHQPQQQKKNPVVQEVTPVSQESKENPVTGICRSAEELNAHSFPEQELKQNENLFLEDLVTLSDTEDIELGDRAEAPEQLPQNQNAYVENVIRVTLNDTKDSSGTELCDESKELKAQSPPKSTKCSQPDEEDDDVQFVAYIIRDNSARLSRQCMCHKRNITLVSTKMQPVSIKEEDASQQASVQHVSIKEKDASQ